MLGARLDAAAWSLQAAVAKVPRALRRARNHQLHLTVGRILDEPLFIVRGKASSSGAKGHGHIQYEFRLEPTRWWWRYLWLGFFAAALPLMGTVAAAGGVVTFWWVVVGLLLALALMYARYFFRNLRRCENFTPALARWYWLPTTEPLTRSAPWAGLLLVLALSLTFGMALAREGHVAALILHQPEAVLLKQAPAELLKQPEAVLLRQPDAVLLKKHGAAVLKQPATNLLKQPAAVLLKQPKAVLLRQPVADIEGTSHETDTELTSLRVCIQWSAALLTTLALGGLYKLLLQPMMRVRQLEELYNIPQRGWSSYERRIVRLVTTQHQSWRTYARHSRGWRAQDDFSQQVLRLGMIEIFFAPSEDRLFKTSALFVLVMMGPVIAPFALLVLLPIINNFLPELLGNAALKIHPGFFAPSILAWAGWGIAYYAHVSSSVMTDLYRSAAAGPYLPGLPRQGYAHDVRRYFSGRGHAIVDAIVVATMPVYVELFLHFLGEH